MQGFVGGKVGWFCADPVRLMAEIKAGKERPIATTGTKRAVLMTAESTLAEAVHTGYTALYAPEVQAAFNNQGIDAQPGTPEELGRYIAREYQTWGKGVKEAGIQAH